MSQRGDNLDVAEFLLIGLVLFVLVYVMVFIVAFVLVWTLEGEAGALWLRWCSPEPRRQAMGTRGNRVSPDEEAAKGEPVLGTGRASQAT